MAEKKEDLPRVSIIMPTHNQAEFIEESLNSIYQQTFQDYEIIVVNDGSTDTTHALLTPQKGKIRYWATAKRGQASAHNLGLEKCRGDLIAFLDSDDLWNPEKLQNRLPTWTCTPR